VATRTLDLRGLLCPLTWARVRRELVTMVPGDRLEVTLDHRPAVPDIRRNAAELGHETTRAEAIDARTWAMTLEVGGAD